MKDRRIYLIAMFILSLMSIGLAYANTATIRPYAQGVYYDWENSGCSNVSEWDCVEENPANISDNVWINAKLDYESFLLASTGLSNINISKVTLYYYGVRYSSTRYKFNTLIRINGTDYLGSLINLTSSYALYGVIYTKNPATGLAWTSSSVNALEVGMKTPSSSYGGIIAQVYAVVEYTYPNNCSDTDGGNYTSVFGTVSGYFNSTAYNNSDVCVGSSNITEYYCSGTSKVTSQQSCGTDGYSGSNFCYAGDVYRNYSDYYCASGACSLNMSQVLQQDCTAGQYCSAGVCVANNTCSDTDGGNSTFVLGTVTGYYNGSSYNNSDVCAGSSNITEYYCSAGYKFSAQWSCGTDGYSGSNFCYAGDVYRNYSDYYCASGACGLNMTQLLQQDCITGQYCSSGQCLWNNSCSDTDGGIVNEILGNVTGWLSQSQYNYQDYCLDNVTLAEYFCSGSNAQIANSSCVYNSSTICYLGECI